MSESVLIGLIEHFGDIVACEPVSRYLRQKYPQAHISWAVRQPFRELIDANPNIDEAIVLNCLTDWIKFYKHRKKEFTAIVDLHVNGRVCEECRVPLVKETGNLFVNAYEWFDHGALLEAFCSGAGIPKLSAQPQIYIGERERNAVDALHLPDKYCVIHRESNAPAKDWAYEKWAALVRFLVEEMDLSVVEVGSRKVSPHNVPLPAAANKASKEISSLSINLLDRTNLLESAEVIRRARLFVGVDSGPAHFANAVKTPGVVIMGRIGYFRQYNPYTGFYASDVPEVRLVRNLMGAAGEVPLSEVTEAVGYILRILSERTPELPFAKAVGASNGASTRVIDPSYRKLVANSGYFDPAWYVTHNPEALAEGVDPLDHYLTIGVKSRKSPSESFDAAWYNCQRPDLHVVDDQLEHFLKWGRDEGLDTRPPRGCSVPDASPEVGHVAATLATLSVKQNERPEPTTVSLPRSFAFYLPQFHPVAENNYGHRPGFTEWDNVIRAKPLFKGHYQPRLPGELGYYDLRSSDVLEEQLSLARNHGLSGFCFYYYYFHGKKLLYKPIQNYLKSGIDAPFLFLWANENWTRRWDGGDNEVLISQGHSNEDDLAFIRELLPTFSDPRYVKIDGKPVLLVYKSHLFPDILKSTEAWRFEASRHGFPDLFLVTADDWRPDPVHPRELGFDASYEIPSNIIPDDVLATGIETLELRDDFTGRIVDYRKFASFHMGRPFPDYKRFRTVMAPWDNTPRYASRAIVHINSDNDAFRNWLGAALLDTSRRYAPEEQLLFVHSWNEWCEGTYLEPDGRTGRRLLEDLKSATTEVQQVLELNCSGDSAHSLAYLFRLARQKDEGAARSLQALRQHNMYANREVEHQRREVARLEKEVANYSSKLAIEGETKAELEASLQTVERSLQTLQIENAAQTVALQSTQQAHERALDDIANCVSESRQVEATFHQIEAKLYRTEATLHQAEANLHNVLHSNSWRLTKPLRALTRIFR